MIVNGKKITGYESVRLSDPSLITKSDSIDENHKTYVNFVSSLKSPITRKSYVIRLKSYLRSPSISFSTFDELLCRDLRMIEEGIIDLLIGMRHEKELSYSAQNVFLSTLVHFFSINDVMINRKKIKKFMSESENKYEYRSYTIEEISSLLEISDERKKVIILLLASTGIRVGAVHPLLFKDLKKWVINENGNYIYQIQVYSSSSKYRYYTFCSPECALAIDKYLEFRKQYGEKLVKTETGWGPANTHLIIRTFNKRSNYHNSIPITYRSTITRNILVPKLESLGLRIKHMKENSKKKSVLRNRYELHPCHSFRIFTITQMQRAKVDKTIREMLVGHSTGLDSVYYKASEEEIFEEYKKAFDYLQINNNFQKISPKENYQKKKENDILLFKEKYEEDIHNLKNDMNDKFTQIFLLIQQNPSLANVQPEILEGIVK